LRALVQRFAEEEKLESAKDLGALGLSPTARQLRHYEARIQRGNVSFAEAWAAAFVQDKFGAATTHWQKLIDRINRGVGNPCPLLLIGLSEKIVTFGEDNRARGQSLD